MIVVFEQDYLRELYEKGKASDKKHRFQPQIVSKFTRTIDLMKNLSNVMYKTIAEVVSITELSNHYK